MNVMQKRLKPGRSVAALPSGRPVMRGSYANATGRWWQHCKTVTIVWLILMLSGCSTRPPLVPDCPAPPEPVAPPAHLLVPLPDPHRHADARATSGAQLLVCARNYQDVLRPALRRLQDWRAWSKN